MCQLYNFHLLYFLSNIARPKKNPKDKRRNIFNRWWEHYTNTFRTGSKPSADQLWGQLMTIIHRVKSEKLHCVDETYPTISAWWKQCSKHNISRDSSEPSANWGQLMTVVHGPRREKLHCVFTRYLANTWWKHCNKAQRKLELLRLANCNLRPADIYRLQAKRTSFAGQRGKSCVVDCVRLWPSGA